MNLKQALRDLSAIQQRVRIWQHLVGEIGRYVEGTDVEQLVTDSGEAVGDDALQDVLSLVEQHAQTAEGELNAFLTYKVVTDDQEAKPQKPKAAPKSSGRKSPTPRRRKATTP